ncbi:MAG: hypothetical protein ACI85O_000234 [Saprospiraceae bacterium]|jgi:hypothetical protein
MKNKAQVQVLRGLCAMLLFCGLFLPTMIAQQHNKFAKNTSCVKTVTFTTQTSINESLSTKASQFTDQKQNFKKGQFSLCIDTRGTTNYEGKGLYPKDLLQIEEFVIALRQSAGDLRPDFNPLIRDAEQRGAKVQRLRDGTVSIKHRLRDGGQWVTLIDLNRQMLLGCSKYNREEYLVTKLVCHYFTDGRQPPMLNYTVYSEYLHQAGLKEVHKKETLTRFSSTVVEQKNSISKNNSTRAAKF